MSLKLTWWLLALCCLFYMPVMAQSGLGYEINYSNGKIIRHSVKFTAPIPAVSTAFDACILWQTYGKHDWEQRRGYPVVGAGITYTGYGNNDIFGHCVGVYPFLQVPIIRGKSLEWTFRFGDGLGYVTRKHTATADTVNPAVSTNLNDFAMFMTDVRYHYDEHWEFQAGLNFSHISNADYYRPNLGVNMAGLHVGFRYFPVTGRPKRIERELPKLKNRWLGELRASISYKEARAGGNPIEPAYIVAAYASKRWHSKNKFFVGADYAYHRDVYAFMRYYGVYIGQDPHKFSWDGAVFFGNEFLVGRLGLIAQVGIYYHQTFLKFDPFYEKIGGHFYLLRQENGPVKEFFLSGLLLTHEISAELAEFGIGVGF